MSSAFRKLPATALQEPRNFNIYIPEEKLVELRQLLNLSGVAPMSYEGSHEDRKWGISTKWLQEAKQTWTNFDWQEGSGFFLRY